MSYNLSSCEMKAINSDEQIEKWLKSKFPFLSDKMTCFFFDSDLECISVRGGFFNLFDIDISEEELIKHKTFFEKLKETFKPFIKKVSLPILDFKPLFLENVVDPNNYVRIEIFNYSDMATYVRKDFIEKNKDNFCELIIESNFEMDDVIFIYDPQMMVREIEVICFESVGGEYLAHLFDRNEYTQYTPESISKYWWGLHFITQKEELDKLKEGVKEKDLGYTPFSKIDFKDGETMIMLER